MDAMVTGVVAILIAVIAALIALFKKKKIGKKEKSGNFFLTDAKRSFEKYRISPL